MAELEADALPIGTDEVIVWRADLDGHPFETVQRLRALLSPDEAGRADRFYFEPDRRRFIICRGILRELLAHHLDRDPRGIVFAYGVNGKPSVAAEPALHFNVAHSDGLALFAVTRLAEIGVDVERIREMPDWESVAAVSFSPRELARLRPCPPEARREEFFRAWTRQEAVLKALGTGLTGAAVDADEGFEIWPLEAGAEFAAALAVVRAQPRRGRGPAGPLFP